MEIRGSYNSFNYFNYFNYSTFVSLETLHQKPVYYTYSMSICTSLVECYIKCPNEYQFEYSTLILLRKFRCISEFQV